ncbi:hypothetical protein GQ457_08G008720 [Hibiscus cannabinus]
MYRFYDKTILLEAIFVFQVLMPGMINQAELKAAKASKQNFGPDIPSHGRRAYQQKSRIEVKDKDLKPKRIKDYLECKISQRSPALLKYFLFNDF